MATRPREGKRGSEIRVDTIFIDGLVRGWLIEIGRRMWLLSNLFSRVDQMRFQAVPQELAADAVGSRDLFAPHLPGGGEQIPQFAVESGPGELDGPGGLSVQRAAARLVGVCCPASVNARLFGVVIRTQLRTLEFTICRECGRVRHTGLTEP